MSGAIVFRAEIPHVVPSANVFLHWHWAKREKVEELWAWRLYVARREWERAEGKSPRLEEPRKRRVLIVRRSPRLLDQANVWTPTDKLIFDSLVTDRILYDDSLDWMEAEIKQEKGTKLTIIEVSEVA